MDLRLTVIKHKGQRPEPPLEVVLSQRSGTIGRKEFNDLVLPDPERFVSSSHARIEYQGGQYFLLDQSTNGTLLNHAPQPVEKGKPIPLSDGDILGIGEYEVRVKFEESQNRSVGEVPGPAQTPAPMAPQVTPPPSPYSSETLDPLALIGAGEGSAPAAGPGPEAPPPPTETQPPEMAPPPVSEPPPVQGPGFSTQSGVPGMEPPSTPGLEIPEDFDLLADLSPSEPAQPDHLPIEQQAFTPPETREETPPLTPESAPASPTGPVTDTGAPVPPEESPTLPDRVPPAQAAPATPPEPVAATPVPSAPSPEIPPPAAEPPPAASTSPTPGAQSESRAVPPGDNGAAASQPPQALPLFDALLEGLGQQPGRPLTPEEQLALARTLGRLVRQTIDGLIRALAVRNEFKRELRLEMTTIRPVENNPLKFSINAQDALQRMLFLQQPGFMGPEQAIEEAFHDIMAHEMAMVAGLQAALQSLLDRFDPKALEEHFRDFGALTGSLPLLREAKYWDVFKKTYTQVRRDAEEGFLHLFGEAFNQAYEEQVHRLRSSASHDETGRKT